VRVLVVEDFVMLRDALAQGLREAGYAVDVASDGEEGLWFARSGTFDTIVLDLMLPKLSGLKLLKRLRESDKLTPVIILTARDASGDRVEGLDGGADDYLVKPFAFAELLARVRALIRRKYEARAPLITVGDMELDTTSREVRRGGQAIPLSGREYALLEFLALRRGEVVARSEIWEHVYDFRAEADSNVVDVYIAHLRRKLEVPESPRLIHTRRGFGYCLDHSVDHSPNHSPNQTPNHSTASEGA
jgi:DNA-binding response OmpR family regulator